MYPRISDIIRLRRVCQAQRPRHSDDLSPVVGAVLKTVECDLRVRGLKNIPLQVAVFGVAGEKRLPDCTQEIRPVPTVVEQAIKQFGIGAFKVVCQKTGGRFARQASQPDILRAPNMQQGAAQGGEGGGRFPGQQGFRFFLEPLAHARIGPEVVV